MSNNITTEFILAEDGKFYKRTACTTVIKNASEVLSSVKDEGVTFLCPLKHPMTIDTSEVSSDLKTSVMTKLMYHTKRQDVVSIFTKLPYFPFPKFAYVYRDSGNSDYYKFQVGTRDSYQAFAEDRRGEWGPVNYQPDSQGLSLFTYCTYSSESKEFSDFRVFVIDNLMNPYTINVANVFDDGRLCAGSDYQRRCSVDSMLAGYHKNLQTMFISPCNNDLRSTTAEAQHMRFDVYRKQLLTLSAMGVIASNDRNFYIPITNDSILEFCKHYGK